MNPQPSNFTTFIHRVLDLIFYTDANRLLFGVDYRYIMYRKSGSVIASTVGAYFVFSKFNLPLDDIIVYTFGTSLFFILLVFHSLTYANLKKQYLNYAIVILLIVSAWSGTGFYLIEGETQTKLKAMEHFNENKYKMAKAKLVKDNALALQDIKQQIEKMKRTDIQTLTNTMLAMRESSKRTYISMYINYIKAQGGTIPSISRSISDEALQVVMTGLANTYVIKHVESIQREQERLDKAWLKKHADDYKELERISFDSITLRNVNKSNYNNTLSSESEIYKYTYAFVFLILGLFMELIAFANGWVRVETVNSEIINNNDDLLRLKSITKSVDEFMEFFAISDVTTKHVNIYMVIVYLLHANKNIDLKKHGGLKLTDVFEVTGFIKNKETGKNYFVQRHFKAVKEEFHKLNINFHTLTLHNVSLILATHS